MGGLDSERFKIVRRNSLRNEVDGSFEDLEDFEDRNEAPAGNSNWVTHQECVLLNRVLSDKTTLPPACHAPPTATVQKVTSQPKAPKPAPRDEGAIIDIVRRITGAVQPTLSSLNPLHAPKKVELGGVVTEEQCKTLAAYISPSIGGQYLLPTACVHLLHGDDAEVDPKGQQAKVYVRIKRHKSVMGKESFPPTMC
ncbi:unnamed protein product [Pylaiella littoralis]